MSEPAKQPLSTGTNLLSKFLGAQTHQHVEPLPSPPEAAKDTPDLGSDGEDDPNQRETFDNWKNAKSQLQKQVQQAMLERQLEHYERLYQVKMNKS
jgi:hypothetical protein